jgi:hypothetical protein
MSTQVILVRRPEGGYFATVVTRSGVELSRDPILTWQDEMRWINVSVAMRTEWDSHGLSEWDDSNPSSQTVGIL